MSSDSPTLVCLCMNTYTYIHVTPLLKILATGLKCVTIKSRRKKIKMAYKNQYTLVRGYHVYHEILAAAVGEELCGGGFCGRGKAHAAAS